jgi:hypothetical protein
MGEEVKWGEWEEEEGMKKIEKRKLKRDCCLCR